MLGFPSLGIVVIWVRIILCWRDIVCSVGYLAASLSSAQQMSVGLPHTSCDNAQCLQILPDIRWGPYHPWLKTIFYATD